MEFAAIQHAIETISLVGIVPPPLLNAQHFLNYFALKSHVSDVCLDLMWERPLTDPNKSCA